MDERTRDAMRNWTLAQPVVSAFVASLVRDFSTRDDVLQDCAVAVIESFDRYDKSRSFVAWALGIAQNQVRLYLRKQQRLKLVFEDEVVCQLAVAFEAEAASQVRPLGFLRDCLGRLDGRAKELCELRYVHDPLQPVPAETPASTKDRFLRGAIAIAANGIPIFNPLNNRGDDAFLFGELDQYGGHCGRADDYHYHIAPVHLERTVGKGKPIAYALDGYPIYGYEEPDGSPVRNLDALNGHKGANGQYHYHATKTYPYLNGGFYGEVVERDGQVDPQPRAEPLRPALPPLQGAKIIGFEETKPGSYKLTYDIRGRNGTVSYKLDPSGSATFEFVDPQGKKTTETYTPGRRGGGGGGGAGGRPPRGGDNPPPPRPGDNPAPRGRGGPRPEQGAMPPERGPQGRPAEPPTAAVVPLNPAASKLTLSSASIDARGRLSIDCTCDGKGESPAIAWKDAPAGTKSFAVSLWHTAPDQEKSYWLVYNIPAQSTGLAQKSSGVGTVGLNDRRKATFDPMCSKGPGVKTYHITVFALKDKLNIAPDQTNRANLLPAIKDLVLAEATLDFQYEREGAR